MPSKKTTKKELEAEVRRLTTEMHMSRESTIAESIVSVVNNLVKWGALALIAYLMAQCIDSLAGEATTSNIAISLVTDLKMNQYLAYAFGGSGIGYGIMQRKSKRDTIERLQGRKEALEQMVDPGRSSSKLTPKGLTRPEDQ